MLGGAAAWQRGGVALPCIACACAFVCVIGVSPYLLNCVLYRFIIGMIVCPLNCCLMNRLRYDVLRVRRVLVQGGRTLDAIFVVILSSCLMSRALID